MVADAKDQHARVLAEHARAQVIPTPHSVARTAMEDSREDSISLLVNRKLLILASLFKNGAKNRDLRCVLHPSILRCRCWVQTTFQVLVAKHALKPECKKV